MLRVLLFVPLWIYHRLDELVTAISDDPLVRAAVEADLGLPPGTLANKDPKSWPNPTPEIRAYVTAADPSAEQLKVTFEALAKYFKFWSDIFAAAETEDGSIVADELLYRLLQTTTADLIKFDYPTVYALMRLTGVIEQNTRLTLEEVFAPEVGANIFRREYWSGWLDRFEANYLRFRLEQTAGHPASDGDAEREGPAARPARLRALGPRVGADRLPRVALRRHRLLLRVGGRAAAARAVGRHAAGPRDPDGRPRREPHRDGTRHARRPPGHARPGPLRGPRRAPGLARLARRQLQRGTGVQAGLAADQGQGHARDARPGRVGRAALQRRVELPGRAGGGARAGDRAGGDVQRPARRSPSPARPAHGSRSATSSSRAS